MHITRLQLWNFRSYQQLELRLPEGISLLTGENGQGKTNILEAVYLLCTGKSHRTSRENDMIMREKAWARVRLEDEQRDGRHTVDMLLEKGRKKILVNGLGISRISELLGQLSGVIFSPEDLYLVKQGPGERRRFMDVELSQVSKKYFYALNEYNKVLEQRNTLLKANSAAKTLDVWDTMLAQRAEPVILARMDFCRRLEPLARENHAFLSSGKEKLSCEYRGCCKGDNIQEEILRQLEENRETDMKRMFTSVGPHKDDIQIRLGDTDLRYFGSQGQQRTATLALKLTELEMMRQDLGEYPVLLLDDVLSELDVSRQQLLLEKIQKVQTLITAAQPIDALFSGIPTAAFRVAGGCVKRER